MASPSPQRSPSNPFNEESPRVVRPLVPAAQRNFFGLCLLLVVVVLWTASAFLQSSVFADSTYSKPYFVTYFNTSCFILPLVLLYLKRAIQRRFGGTQHQSQRHKLARRSDSFEAEPLSRSTDGLLSQQNFSEGHSDSQTTAPPLTSKETFRLSLKFCALWFIALWLNSASFEYTSVASSTILVATSSVFTLLFGVVLKVEVFTFAKLVGVLSSIAGVVLISLIDTSSDKKDEDRGSFPYKTPGQIAIGDIMALMSAVIYGLYATILTKEVGHEEGRVNMPLFFGFIGLVASVVALPGFPIIHFLGIETFELPPTKDIWSVVLINALLSMVGDMCWAFAVLLTSPLVVTVGLALTIPLSLIGQIVLNGQYTGPMYWVGALIIVLSFVWISYENRKASKDQLGLPPKSPRP